MCDHIWDNRLVSENNILYYCFVTFYVDQRCCHPNMKPIQYFISEQDAHLFLASSCSNDYFHAYAIIYFLAIRLVFQNVVTYSYRIFVLSKFLLLLHLRLTEALHKLTACLINLCSNRRFIQSKFCLATGYCPDDFLHVLLACEQFYQ